MTAAVLTLWLGASFLAYARGIGLSAALPLAAAAPPVLLFGALQLWAGRSRADHFASRSAVLQQFQAPAIGDWLARDPGFLLEPVQQTATVVFIDLSGFTGLSETLGPEAVRALLKDFHALVDAEVVTRGGVVISFQGDGAMILFGLPRPMPDDAARAALCCIGLCSRTATWLASLPPSGAAPIGFKIGAHCGDIVASRLGGGSYQHITATGDTVNVASRLMEVAAAQGAVLALSDEMLRAAGEHSALQTTGALTGPLQADIRGRAQAMTVWLWRNDPA
jgi:adenylate cyclase